MCISLEVQSQSRQLHSRYFSVRAAARTHVVPARKTAPFVSTLREIGVHCVIILLEGQSSRQRLKKRKPSDHFILVLGVDTVSKPVLLMGT
jgi:hypothetical protein